MEILEKRDKANRVMVQVFPFSGSQKMRGSRSLTVLNTDVEEVYTIIKEALKKASQKTSQSK